VVFEKKLSWRKAGCELLHLLHSLPGAPNCNSARAQHLLSNPEKALRTRLSGITAAVHPLLQAMFQAAAVA